MKYLMFSLAAYLFLHGAYAVIGEAYEQYGAKLKGSKLQTFLKLCRYAIATSCIIAVFVWKGAEPPILDMSKLQVSEGMVECKNSNGKRSTGVYKMDGVKYMETFGYVFGVSSDAPCDEELNGHVAKIWWLPIYGEKERLIMQISDAKTGVVSGLTIERSLKFYQQEIDSKIWLYLAKLGLLLIAVYFIFWDKAVKMFWLSNESQKNKMA